MTRSGALGIQSAPVSGMSRCLLLAVEAPPLEEKESNWLPAPAGNFSISPRAYCPDQAILDGQWQSSAIEKMK
jgi:hypothetical protein